MLLTVITSDWEYHQKQTTQKVPNKRKQSGQEKEVSFSEYGTVDFLFTVIMSKTSNNMSNRNEEEVTIDSVNNYIKSPPSYSTTKCPDISNKATSFSAEFMIHKPCSYVDEEHNMWCMCELCGSVTVRSRH